MAEEKTKKVSAGTIKMAVGLAELPGLPAGLFEPERYRGCIDMAAKLTDDLNGEYYRRAGRIANYLSALFIAEQNPALTVLGESYRCLRNQIEREAGIYIASKPSRQFDIAFQDIPSRDVTQRDIAWVLDEYGQYYAVGSTSFEITGKEPDTTSLDTWFLQPCGLYAQVRRKEKAFEVTLAEPPLGDFRVEKLLALINNLGSVGAEAQIGR
jgi:hypothetical protein